MHRKKATAYLIISCACSPDLAKSCVFPELTELINDEESSVRVAALEAMADVVPHMSSTAVTVMVVPLVQRVCEQSLSSGRGCLTGVARLLGKLSHQLRGICSILVHVFHLHNVFSLL